MRWLKGVIAIINFFLIVSVSIVFAGEGQDAAKQSNSLFRERAGSEKKLKQNFINPLLGGDKLYTIDQSKSGNVQLVCPSSKEFLTILVIPKETGDFDANIYWDSNMDGTMDKAISVTGVSGLCSNGFIKCDLGTWQNCQNYSFKVEGNNLYLQETYRTELSGCFCINQSCGSNLLWNNLGYVLKTFGGAVATAFQQSDPRYAISDSRLDGTAIYFYGQKTRDCLTAPGGSGSLYPETYWKAPSSIKSSVESLVLSQSQDPESFYNMIVNFATNTPSQVRSCIKKRSVYSNIIDKYDSCSNVTSYPTFNFVGGWDSNGDSKQCFYDRRGYCYVLSGYDSSWDVCYSRIVNEGNLLYFINSSFLLGTGITAVQVTNLSVSGRGNYSSCYGSDNDAWDVWVYVSAVCKYIGCTVQEQIENTCEALESNSSCVLYNEFVDNVQTVRNGVRTGLYPVSKICVITCAEGTCSECGRVYCYDWMTISREYLCTDQPIDLSGAKRRLGSVVPSTQYSSSTGILIYTDVRYESGQWVTYTNQQIQIKPGEKQADCEKVCRVKAPKPNTQVGLGDAVTQNWATTQGNYVFYYRPCSDDVCSIEEGEVIDIPCQCMNDFGAASTLMQTMRLAGQDMICTSGNIKTLPGY